MLKTVFISMGISLIVSVSVILIYDRHYASKVIPVDVKNYLDKQRIGFLTKELTEEDVRKNIKTLADRLDKLGPNKTFILSDVVIKSDQKIVP